MPRGLRNWTFRDVVGFLKSRGFVQSHTRGSHFYYVRLGQSHQPPVCVAFHSSRTIDPRDLKSIIRQSGISHKEWIGK